MKVVVLVGAFILVDLLSGSFNAFKNGEFTSSSMRDGLFHKSSEIFILVIALLLDYTQTVIDLGFTIPLTSGAETYIIFMETCSTIENVGSINPKFVPKKIRSLFFKLNSNELLQEILEESEDNHNED